MSRTFSTNCGSVESLNVSVRCGCSENARQMRCTEEADTPDAFAMARVLQCVASAGFVSKVVVTTSLDLVVADLAWRATSRLVEQPTETLRRKPIAPGRHRDPRDPKPLGNAEIGHAAGRQKHDLGAQGVRPQALPPPRPRLKFGALSACQFDPNRSTAPHPCFPPNTRQAQGITAKQICLETSPSFRRAPSALSRLRELRMTFRYLLSPEIRRNPGHGLPFRPGRRNGVLAISDPGRATIPVVDRDEPPNAVQLDGRGEVARKRRLPEFEVGATTATARAGENHLAVFPGQALMGHVSQDGLHHARVE